MEITAARRHLPIPENRVYLNHAGVSPVCSPAAEAMPGIIADVEFNGMAHIDSWNQLYVDARASGAKLIGTQAHQIAFQKNTTEGISTVANGIHWTPGDNIVLAHGEFLANVYPWLNQAPKGVEIN